MLAADFRRETRIKQSGRDMPLSRLQGLASMYAKAWAEKTTGGRRQVVHRACTGNAECSGKGSGMHGSFIGGFPQKHKLHGRGKNYLRIFQEKNLQSPNSTTSQPFGAFWRTEVSVLAPRWEILNSLLGGIMTNDPVCGMRVDEEGTEFHTMFAGKKYFFCSADCREEFEDQPADYVEQTAA